MNMSIWAVKKIFPLKFIKYLSYSGVQKNSKVVDFLIRSLAETLYWNNFLVSKYIFKFSLSLLELQGEICGP